MPNSPHPIHPTPQGLRGAESNTFTERTIKVRLPDIARRVISENAFSPETVQRIRALIDEMPQGMIRPLEDPGSPDEAVWNHAGVIHYGKNWLDTPWFFAETYFFRRLLEASRYYQLGDGHHVDPFQLQKSQGLSTRRDTLRQHCQTLLDLLSAGEPTESLLRQLLHLDLWGNQVDLSLWPAEAGERPDHIDQQAAQRHILADHSTAVAAHLLALPQPRRVDIVADNSGVELTGDLLLIAYLLEQDLAAEVHLHLKPHPTYVSDAMVRDVHTTLRFLTQDASTATQRVGGSLQEYLRQDRLSLHDHYFWTSPLPLWRIPEDLKADFSQSALVISKGDANYRRLLGDRHWDFTLPFEVIMEYFPTAVAALRTLKAEIVVGLRKEQLIQVPAEDPDWLTSGRWGVIQFFQPGMMD